MFLNAERRPLLVCSPATRTPALFFGGLMGFIRQHALLGATAALPFLPPDFFDPCAFGGNKAVLLLLDAIEQDFAGQKPVQPLLAGFLAAYLQARRAVHQHDASVDLVDVLAAVTTGAHETLFEVFFKDPKLGHATGHLGFLLRANRESTHGI